MFETEIVHFGDISANLDQAMSKKKKQTNKQKNKKKKKQTNKKQTKTKKRKYMQKNTHRHTVP